MLKIILPQGSWIAPEDGRFAVLLQLEAALAQDALHIFCIRFVIRSPSTLDSNPSCSVGNENQPSSGRRLQFLSKWNQTCCTVRASYPKTEFIKETGSVGPVYGPAMLFVCVGACAYNA
jgi:hypothetical protein